VWLTENQGEEEQQIEVSYLAESMNWRADYVVTLNDEDTKADLSCWVTIDNKSGAAYKDANIKLVAGDVNRVRDGKNKRQDAGGCGEAAACPSLRRRIFQYHIYTLQKAFDY
jgi:hypothetical protein